MSPASVQWLSQRRQYQEADRNTGLTRRAVDPARRPAVPVRGTDLRVVRGRTPGKRHAAADLAVACLALRHAIDNETAITLR